MRVAYKSEDGHYGIMEATDVDYDRDRGILTVSNSKFKMEAEVSEYEAWKSIKELLEMGYTTLE